MPKSRARRYSVEIKDAKGAVLFSTIAYWDDRDRRVALAQITRLAGLPEVNFHTKLAAKGGPPLIDQGQRRRDPHPVDWSAESRWWARRSVVCGIYPACIDQFGPTHRAQQNLDRLEN
jgi:hypothetical protein